MDHYRQLNIWSGCEKLKLAHAQVEIAGSGKWLRRSNWSSDHNLPSIANFGGSMCRRRCLSGKPDLPRFQDPSALTSEARFERIERESDAIVSG